MCIRTNMAACELKIIVVFSKAVVPSMEAFPAGQQNYVV